MKKSEFVALMAKQSQDPAFVVGEPQLIGYYPFWDITARIVHRAAVAVCEVQRVGAPGDRHQVVIGYMQRDARPEYSVWCGDKFLEGEVEAAEARRRCESLGAGARDPEDVVTEALSNYHRFSGPDEGVEACKFWQTWRRSKGAEACEHVHAALFEVREKHPGLLAELEALYAPSAPAEPDEDSAGGFELTELAWRVPVLYEGERGAGKTFEARAFARANAELLVEYGGHEGTEAPDLLGYLVPMPGNGKEMVWKDGPVSEAFRAAQAGRKTMLILDELLRIRARELSVLLTAFSPDEGKYRLRTGRIVSVTEGVAREETLEAPVENLCVVATTNVGAEYAVDALDPALAERFVVLRKDTELARLRAILATKLEQRGLPQARLLDALCSFYEKMCEARKQGLVAQIPTTRTLSRAVELASTPAQVVRMLRTQRLLWVARDIDGHPVAEQLEHVERFIDRLFARALRGSGK